MATVAHDPVATYLVRCLRVTCGGTDDLAPAEPLDWSRLATAAAQHGIAPQVAGLALQREREVPDAFVSQLAKERQRAIRGHLLGLASVRETERLLTCAGVPFLVLKGPALTASLYGESAERAYSDVDVLVPRADRDRAIEAFARSSYRAEGGALAQRFVRHAHFHLVFESTRQDRAKVELHWALVDAANLLRVEHAPLFERRREIRAGGTTIPALALEDELVYLCLHLAKHALFNAFALDAGEPPEWFCRMDTGNRLRWFLDVHATLARYGDTLDWPLLRARLEDWNAADEVRTTLSALARLVPDGVARSALDRLDLARPQTAPRRTLTTSKLGRRILEGSMGTIPGVSIRFVRFVSMGNVLFPAPRKLLRYYDDDATWRLPLHYAAHPFRLVAKAWRGGPWDRAGAAVTRRGRGPAPSQPRQERGSSTS